MIDYFRRQRILKMDYKLFRHLFYRNLALNTSIAKRILSIGRAETMATYATVTGRLGLRRFSQYYFHILLKNLLNDRSLSELESDQVFCAFDWNESGVVDEREAREGFGLLFADETFAILLFFKRFIELRTPIETTTTKHEVRMMFDAAVQYIKGADEAAIRELERQVQQAMSCAEITGTSHASGIPITALRAAITLEAPAVLELLEHVSGLQTVAPTWKVRFRTPSPDPERDIRALRERKALVGFSEQPARSSLLPVALSNSTRYGSDEIKATHYRADAFIVKQMYFADVPEHPKH